MDGTNLYTYVKQNPWTKFDPLGLAASSTSGNGDAQKDGKKAHQEFQPFRGGKETQLITSTAKAVRTDSLVITDSEVRVNELKPMTRLENSSKKNSALRQLADQMDGAARNVLTEGKKVVGELWGWTKVNGKMVFTKVQEVGGKHGGKVGAVITLATAATAEGSVSDNLAVSLAPNTKAAMESEGSGLKDYAKAIVTDVGHNLDPGISIVVNRENAESAGRGFWNSVSAGEGNYGDYSQSHKYDLFDSFKSSLRGAWDYITGK